MAYILFFFFNDTATTEIYTLSLHDALPISHVESLYLAHHGWLQGWLRKKVGNAFDAADLAQSTFLKVLGAKGLDQLQEPRAYLTTIARNLLINQVRRRAIEQIGRAHV